MFPVELCKLLQIQLFDQEVDLYSWLKIIICKTSSARIFSGISNYMNDVIITQEQSCGLWNLLCTHKACNLFVGVLWLGIFTIFYRHILQISKHSLHALILAEIPNLFQHSNILAGMPELKLTQPGLLSILTEAASVASLIAAPLVAKWLD